MSIIILDIGWKCLTGFAAIFCLTYAIQVSYLLSLWSRSEQGQNDALIILLEEILPFKQFEHVWASTIMSYLIITISLPWIRCPPKYNLMWGCCMVAVQGLQILDALGMSLMHERILTSKLGEDAPWSWKLIKVVLDAFVRQLVNLWKGSLTQLIIVICFLLLGVFPFYRAVQSSHRLKKSLTSYLFVVAILILAAIMILTPYCLSVLYTQTTRSIPVHNPGINFPKVLQGSPYHPIVKTILHPRAALKKMIVVSERAIAGMKTARKRSYSSTREHFKKTIRRLNPITDHPGRLSVDLTAHKNPNAYLEMFDAIWRRQAEPSVLQDQKPDDPERFLIRSDKFEAAAKLLQEHAIHKSTGKRRNIVLVVLESTGVISSMGLSDDKEHDLLDMKFDPNLTPSLAKLLEHSKPAIMWDRMATSYPASAKSIGTILSGHAPSWGSAARKYVAEQVGGSALPRMLKLAGFRTLFVSSSLDLDWDWTRWALEDSFGFEKVIHCNTSVAAKRQVNSWACDEAYAWESLLDWIKNPPVPNDDRPFFAIIFTTAGHYPYSVSREFARMAAAKQITKAGGRMPFTEKESEYLRTVSYTDYNLGSFIRSLREENSLADNVLFGILGDHGESFGERHAQNTLHRNHVYEENVRLFFILAQPHLDQERGSETFAWDHRPCSNIDVSLTLLAATNITPEDGDLQPSRNLLARTPNQTGNVIYFLKRSQGGIVGLLDGQWKFMMALDAEEKAEFDALYNLIEDPHEQTNLLRSSEVSSWISPQLVQSKYELYSGLAEMWYGMADCEYYAQFEQLSLHPFCRVVHKHRGPRFGRLRGISSARLVSRANQTWIMRICANESDILPRHGQVQLLRNADQCVALDNQGWAITIAAVPGTDPCAMLRISESELSHLDLNEDTVWLIVKDRFAAKNVVFSDEVKLVDST